MNIQILGAVATCCTTFCFVFQIYKIQKTHDVSGISGGMFMTIMVGCNLWGLYGALTHSWPVLISNCISLVLASAILLLKRIYSE